MNCISVDVSLVYGHRFEPDMLAFSGCYYGGGEVERQELGEIRKRWKSLHVSFHFVRETLTFGMLKSHPYMHTKPGLKIGNCNMKPPLV